MLPELAKLTIQEKDTDVAFTFNNVSWATSYRELTNDYCHICHAEFDMVDGNNKIVVLDCLHIFHEHCITDWIQIGRAECPECMKPVNHDYNSRITAPPLVEELFFDAVSFNRLGKVQDYLDQGVNVNTLNSEGATALIVACKEKNEESALFLLKQPNIDITHAEDTSGKTALH